jgi:hypothetical protein
MERMSEVEQQSDVPRFRPRRPIQTRLDFRISFDVDDVRDERELLEAKRVAEPIRWDDL